MTGTSDSTGEDGLAPGPISRRSFVKYGGVLTAAGLSGVGAGAASAQDPASRPRQGATTAPPGHTVALYDMQDLYSLDLSDPAQAASAYDQLQLVFTLQGIVNRNRPRLYVNYTTSVGFFDGLPDQYWLAKLQEQGGLLDGWDTLQVSTLDDLVQMFLPLLRGAVVWDPNVWSTSNVASTVAGVEDLVAVRYDTTPGSLYEQYVATNGALPPARVWLVNQDGSSLFTGSGTIPGTDVASSGSAKCDAYLWAKVKYLDSGRCDPSQLGYYLDAYWLVDPTVGSFPAAWVANHDFMVSKRGFIFDLSPWGDEAPPDDPHQPLGTDLATLQAIIASAYEGTKGQMTAIHGFVPWQYKYTSSSAPVAGANGAVQTEWQLVQTVSAYNCYLDGDAPAAGDMANASVYTHVVLRDSYPQPAGPTVAELQQRGYVNADGSVVPKRYVMFYVGDYDSAAWMYHALPGLWDDPNRGSLPLNWAFDPELSDRIAPAFLYTRATKSDNDFFIAGDSGAGYLNPSLLEVPRSSGLPSGLAAWQRHCSHYFRLWDISITGFVIDGNAPPMSQAGLQTYAQFSYNGFAEQDAAGLGIVGTTPYQQMGIDLTGTAAQAAAQIEGTLGADTSQAPYAPAFYSLRTILESPTWHQQAAAQVQADLPNAAVEFVDAFTLYALIRQYLEDQVVVLVSASERSVVAGQTVPVLLQLDNFLSTSTNGTVTVTGPSGWTTNPSSVSFSLDSGESELIWVNLGAPSTLDLGQGQEVQAVVSFNGTSRSYAFGATSFPSVTANQATSVPALDGTVDSQWQAAQAITVTPDDPIVEQFGMVWDVAPLGGTISTLWDADNLYVLAQINDANVMAPDGTPWLDDGVAIYLSYNDWAFKVVATVPTASGSSLVYYQAGTATSTDGNGTADASAAQVGFLQTASGYNLAMAIPWNQLVGFTGEAGNALRFTPLILDRTGASESDWGQIMWCGNDDNPQINGFLFLGS